jgi:hypothetical protein
VETVDGKSVDVIEYTVPNNGTPILFQHMYLTEAGIGSIQILAYSVPDNATAAAFKLGEFMATVKFGG